MSEVNLSAAERQYVTGLLLVAKSDLEKYVASCESIDLEPAPGILSRLELVGGVIDKLDAAVGS